MSDWMHRGVVAGNLCLIMEMVIDKNHIGVTAYDIAEQIDMSSRQAWRYLRSLEASGFVERRERRFGNTAGRQFFGVGERLREMSKLITAKRPHGLTSAYPRLTEESKRGGG